MSLKALLLPALGLAWAAAAGGPEAAWRLLEAAPGSGATCIVCGGPPTGEGDRLLEHRGRAVAVCGRPPCLPAWSESPQRFFRKVQARSALFDEEAVAEGRRISAGWLIVGLYVLLGTLSGGACAYLAVARGLSPVAWFFYGLAANAAALVAVFARGRGDLSGLPQGVPPGLRKVPRTRAPRACPGCGAPAHPAGARCPACGQALEPGVQAETQRV